MKRNGNSEKIIEKDEKVKKSSHDDDPISFSEIPVQSPVLTLIWWLEAKKGERGRRKVLNFLFQQQFTESWKNEKFQFCIFAQNHAS